MRREILTDTIIAVGPVLDQTNQACLVPRAIRLLLIPRSVRWPNQQRSQEASRHLLCAVERSER